MVERTIYLDGAALDVYQKMLDDGIGTGGEKELINAWNVDFGDGVIFEIQVFDLIDDGPYVQSLLYVNGVLVSPKTNWYTQLEGIHYIKHSGETYVVDVVRA